VSLQKYPLLGSYQVGVQMPAKQYNFLWARERERRRRNRKNSRFKEVKILISQLRYKFFS
jgi:hypothetical protein